MLMAKKICKSNPQWEEVGHYCIAQFAEHERATELVEANMAMKFISGMIWRSYWSETSRYHYKHRENNRMVLNGWDKPENAYIDNIQDTEYDQHTDDVIQAILGILEDMKHTAGEGGNRDKRLWEMAVQLELYFGIPEDRKNWDPDTPATNYSQLSRRTKVPRTTIMKDVAEGLEYIKQVLKNNNINYDPT